MPLRADENEQVYEIAQQVVKQEIGAMGKRPKELANKLEAVITDLEAKIKELEMKVKELEVSTIDLKAEIKKVLQPASAHQNETPKSAKKGVFK